MCVVLDAMVKWIKQGKIRAITRCKSPNQSSKYSSKGIIFSVKRVPNIKSVNLVESTIKDN